MIIVSNHIATNMMIDYLGLDTINACIQKLGCELLHLMVKSSVAQNKTDRDTIQLDFLQKACKVA